MCFNQISKNFSLIGNSIATNQYRITAATTTSTTTGKRNDENEEDDSNREEEEEDEILKEIKC